MVITNKHNLPPHVVRVLTEGMRPPERNTVHVTELIDDIHRRSMSLQHYGHQTFDASDMMWAMLGKMGHKVMEQDPSIVSEYNVKLTFGYDSGINSVTRLRSKSIDRKPAPDEIALTGTVDAYDPVTKTLYDNKFVTHTAITSNPSDGKKVWRDQLTVYKYMLNQVGITVRQAYIIAFIRNMTVYDALKHDMPDSNIVPVQIELPTMRECEEYVFDRLNEMASLTFEGKETTECSQENRWNRSKYRAFVPTKPGAKNPWKSIGTFDTEHEAVQALDNANAMQSGTVEEIEGKDIRCINYCQYKEFCDYGKVL